VRLGSTLYALLWQAIALGLRASAAQFLPMLGHISWHPELSSLIFLHISVLFIFYILETSIWPAFPLPMCRFGPQKSAMTPIPGWLNFVAWGVLLCMPLSAPAGGIDGNADGDTMNFTRLYILDGREFVQTDPAPVAPSSFAIMRPPWMGIGGYASDIDSFGADDFVIVGSELYSSGYSDGAISRKPCLAFARVEPPALIDPDIRPNNSHAMLVSNRMYRPWLRT